MRICHCLLVGLFLILAAPALGGEEPWIDLFGSDHFESWRAPTGAWAVVGSVELDPKNPRLLLSRPGKGVRVNGPKGRTNNLITKDTFTDVEVHAEFLIPRGSNSGIKLMGLYEIQILDRAGVKELTGDHCGGIYPRAEEKPRYHHIDKGVPPKVNAAKPAGEWQSLDIVFTAPRFDAAGKKVANARFVKVVLNDQVVHEDVEVPYPTGAAWRLRQETASGPLLLQADHGPVAFRNVRLRPYGVDPKKN
jgi:hypothetical protein